MGDDAWVYENILSQTLQFIIVNMMRIRVAVSFITGMLELWLLNYFLFIIRYYLYARHYILTISEIIMHIIIVKYLIN
jgi:hypothetical protein